MICQSASAGNLPTTNNQYFLPPVRTRAAWYVKDYQPRSGERQVTVGLSPLSNVQWRQIKLQASRSLVFELARVTAGEVLPVSLSFFLPRLSTGLT